MLGISSDSPQTFADKTLQLLPLSKMAGRRMCGVEASLVFGYHHRSGPAGLHRWGHNDSSDQKPEVQKTKTELSPLHKGGRHAGLALGLL